MFECVRAHVVARACMFTSSLILRDNISYKFSQVYGKANVFAVNIKHRASRSQSR